MMKEAGKPKVKAINVTKASLKALVPEYQKALQNLPAVLEVRTRLCVSAIFA